MRFHKLLAQVLLAVTLWLVLFGIEMYAFGWTNYQSVIAGDILAMAVSWYSFYVLFISGSRFEQRKRRAAGRK